MVLYMFLFQGLTKIIKHCLGIKQVDMMKKSCPLIQIYIPKLNGKMKNQENLF